MDSSIKINPRQDAQKREFLNAVLKDKPQHFPELRENGQLYEVSNQSQLKNLDFNDAISEGIKHAGQFLKILEFISQFTNLKFQLQLEWLKVDEKNDLLLVQFWPNQEQSQLQSILVNQWWHISFGVLLLGIATGQDYNQLKEDQKEFFCIGRSRSEEFLYEKIQYFKKLDTKCGKPTISSQFFNCLFQMTVQCFKDKWEEQPLEKLKNRWETIHGYYVLEELQEQYDQKQFGKIKSIPESINKLRLTGLNEPFLCKWLAELFYLEKLEGLLIENYKYHHQLLYLIKLLYLNRLYSLHHDLKNDLVQFKNQESKNHYKQYEQQFLTYLNKFLVIKNEDFQSQYDPDIRNIHFFDPHIIGASVWISEDYYQYVEKCQNMGMKDSVKHLNLEIKYQSNIEIMEAISNFNHFSADLYLQNYLNVLLDFDNFFEWNQVEKLNNEPEYMLIQSSGQKQSIMVELYEEFLNQIFLFPWKYLSWRSAQVNKMKKVQQ